LCVINVISNKSSIPSDKMVDKMAIDNPHKCSIMYFDEKLEKIYYKKGIESKELKEIMIKAKQNTNILQHYRIASHGSADNPFLNHGFMIKNGVKNDLEGMTNNDIIVHNGTLDLNELEDIAIKIMINNPKAIYPQGEISDTYLLSFILSHVNYSILHKWTDHNKFAIMNGKTGKITKYGKWNEIKDNKNTLVCSNDYFVKTEFDFADTYVNNQESYLDFLNKKEKKEIKRLLKKYDEITMHTIEEFLDMGFSVYDIEDQIESELKYIDNMGYEY